MCNFKYDIVYEGGSLLNINDALKKCSTKKILIITKETFLGDEINIGNFYILPRECSNIKLLENCFDLYDDYIQINPSILKKSLEDLLINNNIDFLYSSYLGEYDNEKIEVTNKTKTIDIYTNELIPDFEYKKRSLIAQIEKHGQKKIFCVDTKDLHSGKEKILCQYPKDYTLGRIGSMFEKLDIVDHIDKSPKERNYSKKTKRLNKYDVVVVGGGTSGVMSAISIAKKGHKVLIIELNDVLGGTGTIGGVSTYWFGHRYEDVSEIDKKVEELSRKYNIKLKQGNWGKYDDFHPDIKSYVLQEECNKYNIDIEFKSIFKEITKVEKTNKYNIVFINDSICNVESKYVIDATGDADVVKYIGCDYTYGDEYVTFWTSLAQYTNSRYYKNNFSSSVNLDDFFDYTNFIYTSKRRGNAYDYGKYVAPRESRHIIGEYVIKLEDIISFKQYYDGIYTMYSNYDPKGKVDNKMINFGFLPNQNSLQVPLRAHVPKKDGTRVDNVFVLGKAISCKHDSFAPLRMQPDLMHQGYVIGIIISELISNHITIDDLDYETLRIKIFEETGDKNKLYFKDYKHSLRDNWVNQLFEDESHEYSFIHKKLVCGLDNSDEIINKFNQCQEITKKLTLGRLLLYNNIEYPQEYIEEFIISNLKNKLPERNGSTMCVNLLPDHGVMPELVYLINSLSACRNINIDIFKTIYKHLRNGRDYKDIKKGTYHYIECFAIVNNVYKSNNLSELIYNILQFPEFDYYTQKENRFDILAQRILLLKFELVKSLIISKHTRGYIEMKKMTECYDSIIREKAKLILSKEF